MAFDWKLVHGQLYSPGGALWLSNVSGQGRYLPSHVMTLESLLGNWQGGRFSFRKDPKNASRLQGVFKGDPHLPSRSVQVVFKLPSRVPLMPQKDMPKPCLESKVTHSGWLNLSWQLEKDSQLSACLSRWPQLVSLSRSSAWFLPLLSLQSSIKGASHFLDGFSLEAKEEKGKTLEVFLQSDRLDIKSLLSYFEEDSASSVDQLKPHQWLKQGADMPLNLSFITTDLIPIWKDKPASSKPDKNSLVAHWSSGQGSIKTRLNSDMFRGSLDYQKKTDRIFLDVPYLNLDAWFKLEKKAEQASAPPSNERLKAKEQSAQDPNQAVGTARFAVFAPYERLILQTLPRSFQIKLDSIEGRSVPIGSLTISGKHHPKKKEVSLLTIQGKLASNLDSDQVVAFTSLFPEVKLFKPWQFVGALDWSYRSRRPHVNLTLNTQGSQALFKDLAYTKTGWSRLLLNWQGGLLTPRMDTLKGEGAFGFENSVLLGKPGASIQFFNLTQIFGNLGELGDFFTAQSKLGHLIADKAKGNLLVHKGIAHFSNEFQTNIADGSFQGWVNLENETLDSRLTLATKVDGGLNLLALLLVPVLGTNIFLASASLNALTDVEVDSVYRFHGSLSHPQQEDLSGVERKEQAKKEMQQEMDKAGSQVQSAEAKP